MTQLTPGRIAALVVGVPVAVAIVCWTSYSFVALAGQGTMPVSATIPVVGGGLTADIAGSEILLKQAPVKNAELTGTAHYSLFKPALTESSAGAGTSIAFQCRNNTGNCSLDGTLQVPVRTGVTLSTEGSNASIPDFSGSLVLNTGGGDVMAGSVSGKVQMQTAGGNVGADTLSGSLNLQTGGGDLNVNTVNSDILFQATTVGGNVSVLAMADPDATIGSGGGDVTLTFTVAPEKLQITSVGGNITVVLPPGGTEYNIQASTGGGKLSDSTVHQDSNSTNVLILDSGGGYITVS